MRFQLYKKEVYKEKQLSNDEYYMYMSTCDYL